MMKYWYFTFEVDGCQIGMFRTCSSVICDEDAEFPLCAVSQELKAELETSEETSFRCVLNWIEVSEKTFLEYRKIRETIPGAVARQLEEKQQRDAAAKPKKFWLF